MYTPNETGSQFEKRCFELLTTYGITYDKHKRIRNGNTWYEPDVITDSYVIELKFQQVQGSANKKLTQALFELDWLSNKLDKIPVLVYDGARLASLILKDPAFKKASSLLPHIQVLNFEAFNDLISTSTNLNNREQNRLLEYA